MFWLLKIQRTQRSWHMHSGEYFLSHATINFTLWHCSLPAGRSVRT
uniref:Uncharacterized protein n=1 Tax=Anguilla anguilla TaxID=7936 RepID=A0A0E9WDH7_ANGAN